LESADGDGAGSAFQEFQQYGTDARMDETDELEREFKAKDRRLANLQQRQTPVYFSADRQEYLETEQALVLEGNVKIRKDDFRLQADHVRINEVDSTLVATGNLEIHFGQDLITAERGVYHFTTRRAELYNCRGVIVPSVYFDCAFLEKLADYEPTGKAQYYFEMVEVTSCDGQTPAWDFKAPRALARIENYLFLNRPSFRIKQVPVLLTPYWVHPIKSGRVTGLLIPAIAFSTGRGMVFREEFFWPVADNVDVLLGTDIETNRGIKGRLSAEYAMSQYSRGRLRTSYRKAFEQSTWQGDADNQWLAVFEAYHQFPAEFRGQIRGNFQSTEYRDDAYATGYTPPGQRFLDSYATLSRYWSPEYLRISADLTRDLEETRKRQLRSLPRIEADTGDERIGRTGLRWRLNARADNVLREGYETYTTVDNGRTVYSQKWLSRELQRAEFNPSVKYLFTGISWLTIVPSLDYRMNWWSAARGTDADFPAGNWAIMPAEVLDPPPQQSLAGTRTAGAGLVRYGYKAAVDFSGPELYRIFDVRMGMLDKLKHVITPKINYTYAPEIDDSAAPQLDARDNWLGVSVVTYGLENSFYGKFSRQENQSPIPDEEHLAQDPLPTAEDNVDDSQDQDQIQPQPESFEDAFRQAYSSKRGGSARAIVRRIAYIRLSQSYDAAKEDLFERHEQEFERGLRIQGGLREDRPRGNIILQTDISPVPNFSFDYDMAFDPYEEEITRTNLGLRSYWKTWWIEASWTRDFRTAEQPLDDFNYLIINGYFQFTPAWTTEFRSAMDLEREVVDGLLIKLSHHAQCWSVSLDNYYQHRRRGVFPEWELDDEFSFGISFRLKNIGDVGFFDLGSYRPGS